MGIIHHSKDEKKVIFISFLLSLFLIEIYCRLQFHFASPKIVRYFESKCNWLIIALWNTLSESKQKVQYLIAFDIAWWFQWNYWPKLVHEMDMNKYFSHFCCDTKFLTFALCWRDVTNGKIFYYIRNEISNRRNAKWKNILGTILIEENSVIITKSDLWTLGCHCENGAERVTLKRD